MQLIKLRDIPQSAINRLRNGDDGPKLQLSRKRAPQIGALALSRFCGAQMDSAAARLAAKDPELACLREALLETVSDGGSWLWGDLDDDKIPQHSYDISTLLNVPAIRDNSDARELVQALSWLYSLSTPVPSRIWHCIGSINKASASTLGGISKSRRDIDLSLVSFSGITIVGGE